MLCNRRQSSGGSSTKRGIRALRNGVADWCGCVPGAVRQDGGIDRLQGRAAQAVRCGRRGPRVPPGSGPEPREAVRRAPRGRRQGGERDVSSFAFLFGNINEPYTGSQSPPSHCPPLASVPWSAVFALQQVCRINSCGRKIILEVL